MEAVTYFLAQQATIFGSSSLLKRVAGKRGGVLHMGR